MDLYYGEFPPPFLIILLIGSPPLQKPPLICCVHNTHTQIYIIYRTKEWLLARVPHLMMCPPKNHKKINWKKNLLIGWIIRGRDGL